MCHRFQSYTPPKVVCTLLFTLLITGPIDIASHSISHSINSVDDTSSPPMDKSRHLFYSPQLNKQTPKTPIALSTLRGPASVSSAAKHMILVDLSALHHHMAISPANVARPYDDYYSTSSFYDHSESRSEPWEEALLSDEHPQRRHRSRHEDQEYSANKIGLSDRLLLPFAAENTAGLHYNTSPLLEDVLGLQGSREDALTDFIREQLGDQDSKRSVFVSQSWLPGGHPEPRHGPSYRRPPGHVRKNLPLQAPPALPLIFSSKSWHPGGRKRNALDDSPWSKRSIFFSSGWGSGGEPLRYPQKKLMPDNGDTGSEITEQTPTTLVLVSETVEEKAQSQKRPRRHCSMPQLFGTYW